MKATEKVQNYVKDDPLILIYVFLQTANIVNFISELRSKLYKAIFNQKKIVYPNKKGKMKNYERKKKHS